MGSGSPSSFGDSVTFTATVTANSGTTSPTGTVDFRVDGTDTATAILSPSAPGQSTATFATCTLPVAGSPHTVTAVYSGDYEYDQSQAPNLPQTVNTNSGVTSCTAQDVVGGSNPGDPGSIAATATGATAPDAWVSVASSGGDPEATSPPSAGNYLDVKLSSATDFTGVTIVDCDLGGGTSSIYWYDGTAWQQVAASQVTFGDPSAGCATLTIGSGDPHRASPTSPERRSRRV